MKKSLSAGLATLLPIALTVWIFKWFFDLMTDPLMKGFEKGACWLGEKYGFFYLCDDKILSLISRLGAFLLTIGIVFLIGFMGRRFFFKTLLKLLNRVMTRIPVVGTVYHTLRDIFKTVFLSDKKIFRETVMVPFPGPSTYSLAFVTGDLSEDLKQIIPEVNTTVFVPTAPHPISGYILLCRREHLHSTSISIQDTFKFLFSCGAIPPSSL